MKLSEFNPQLPLFEDITQPEVDFVIPRLGVDIPLGIDPFLLYKSRNSTFVRLHDIILKAFNAGIQALREGKSEEARYLFDFPEVHEIGFGYSRQSKRGSGVGDFLASLIIEALENSPALLERGVRHIEEMQLASIGIGSDRISDITANLIKAFLIEYTQKQCKMWEIPLMQNVPISHIFDPDCFEWCDRYVDLPISPVDKQPILLVPRRIVRNLPWINYDDYFRTEFSSYLRAIRKKGGAKAKKSLNKNQVISITRAQIERIDRYIKAKEETAAQAQPSLDYIDTAKYIEESHKLKALLNEIPIGRDHATKYQQTVLEILNLLFNPELIDGEVEVRTVEGTERRDIIFTNDSDQSFWNYIRNEHSSFLLMFEVKNTPKLEASHLNQTATYLGDRIGRLGFIVTRNSPSEAYQKKAFSIFNDSNPREIILFLSDADLMAMLDMKCQSKDPMRLIQKVYRKFRQTVQ